MREIEPGLLGPCATERQHRSDVFYFRFKPAGWVQFVICEETGLFAVHSDWVTAAYCWPRWAGKLKKELVTSHPDYICTKLGYGRGWDRGRLDVERTIDSLKAMVMAEPDMDMHYRGNLLSDINGFDVDLREGGPDVAYNNAPRRLHAFFGNELYDYMVWEPSNERVVLEKGLIPFLQNWLEARQEAA